MKCENLDVWKRACRVSVEIYRLFENCRDYGFKDQITRSGLSVASNIAEGVERYSNQETVRFLDIARASAAELVTQLYIAIEIGFLGKEAGVRIKIEMEEIAKMITNLIKSYRAYK